MLLSWRFLRGAALAYGIAMMLVWLMWLGLLAGSQNGREYSGTGDVLGPDFPAFYTAGWMLRHDDTDALYDFKQQQRLQQQFFPGATVFEYGVSAYINPPHYGWMMQPLSTLKYPAAFALWTLFQIGCFAASIMLLRALLPGLRTSRGALLIVLACLFAPVYFFLSDGQNTGLTLLLHTGVCVALSRRRDSPAGAFIAAGLFKPQLFLGLLPALALMRRWRALLTFALGAAVVATITSQIGGAALLGSWWKTVRSPDYEDEIARQIHGMYSWSAFWELLLGNNVAAALLGYACALATFFWMCLLWRQVGNRSATSEMPLLYAITVCATILISPHLFAYDLALLVLPGLIIANRVLEAPREHHMALRLCLLGLYAGALLVDQAQYTRVQFLVPLLTVTMLLATRLLPRTVMVHTSAPLQPGVA